MMNKCRKVVLKLFNTRFSELEKSERAWVAHLDPRVGKRMPHLSAADTQRADTALLAATHKMAEEYRGESAHQTPDTTTHAKHRKDS
ncbi:hypothetical protein PC129_g14047 [Phytophthora cactorum]|uniref:Uncharacterized protein n=1 Tax=Phytophthora cactorum TaxID=29920 RepID=A0A329RSE0_9STRA|nr:hypothetical protein Pcac1_g21511 [Phytophthora cactorum]KAG2811579.1 hypothetical protein PC112_g15535 [Phytophthora cactorum]KAG2815293.1 hypothetical protein PC111_g13625 [Phytophthora cactorum]KAG2865989.1 hypothetical protein PC113_g3252 [Phytophthora cactorum]KAG2891104.1 hypothetical protein PC114_g17127 [Phytophthora cactorum]